MRVIAVIVGGLLLVGGGALVVVADQQRVAALEAARTAVEQTREDLEKLEHENAGLDEALTALRAQIAEQEKQLADTTGMLQ
jgi:septal ring factor EnvC (AmiA/AmiB activator)